MNCSFKGDGRRSFLITLSFWSVVLRRVIQEWRHGCSEKSHFRRSWFLPSDGKMLTNVPLSPFHHSKVRFLWINPKIMLQVISPHSPDATGAAIIVYFLFFVKSRLEQREVSPLTRLLAVRIWQQAIHSSNFFLHCSILLILLEHFGLFYLPFRIYFSVLPAFTYSQPAHNQSNA